MAVCVASEARAPAWPHLFVAQDDAHFNRAPYLSCMSFTLSWLLGFGVGERLPNASLGSLLRVSALRVGSSPAPASLIAGGLGLLRRGVFVTSIKRSLTMVQPRFERSSGVSWAGVRYHFPVMVPRCNFLAIANLTGIRLLGSLTWLIFAVLYTTPHRRSVEKALRFHKTFTI